MISMAKALNAADQNIVSETGMAARPIVLIVATYIVTTLLQGALGSIPINKILGFALVVLLIFEWVSTRRSHLSYLGLLCFVLLSLHSTLVMISASQELNDLVYLASTMLMISLICSPRFRTSILEALLQYRTYISVVVIFSSMFLLLLLATGTGYVVAWGEAPYFKGLCNTEHTLASICTLLLVLIIFLVRTNGSKAVYCGCSLVIIYATLETGARTFLVPVLICLLLLIQNLFAYKWTKAALLLLVLFFGEAVFLKSGMANKFEFASGNIYADSLLSAITNGRNEIWLTDILAWANSGSMGIAFGNAFSTIYELNKRALSLYIWAHDDLVMLLYGFGLTGLCLYLACLCTLFHSLFASLNKGAAALLSVFILFPLLLNGFFPYQHLVFAFVLLYSICSHELIPRKDI